jgi:hypothetical protein
VKKRIISLIVIFLLVWPVSLYAAPSAGLQGDIISQSRDAGGIRFSLAVRVTEPSESYAALDFTLITADPEHLYIADDGTDAEKNLLIDFPGVYGNAYHMGRLDEISGAYSHLIGIFAQSGQNEISASVTVCNIDLVYTGTEPVELALRDLQLVYLDETRTVRTERPGGDFDLMITEELFRDIPDGNVPQGFPPLGNGLSPWLLVAVLCVGIGAGVGVTVVLNKRRTKTSGPKES